MGKKNDNRIKGSFLDGVDLNDQVAMRDAVVDLFNKKGNTTVVQVGEPGFQISLSNLGSMEKDAPINVPAGGAGSDPAGARSILKKIGEMIVQTSKRSTEIPKFLQSAQTDPSANDGKKGKGKGKGKRKKGSVRFYWQYGEDNGDGPYYLITPKEFFDAEGTIYDDHFDEGDLPPGFSNLMESTFVFDGTRQQAEALLRANPLFEEKEMV